jgi:beta-lactamase class A
MSISGERHLPNGAAVLGVEQQAPLAEIFEQAKLTGFMHAVELESGAETGLAADEPVVLASVFKLPVLLELFRQHHAGELDATALIDVPVAGRTAGPTGLSLMRDPLKASLRDLAFQMIVVSDNAATDVVCAHVGLDNVNRTMASLGLEQTRVTADCAGVFQSIADDLGVASMAEFNRLPTWDDFTSMRACHPPTAQHVSTPREMTTLLSLIWQDQAGSPEACADVRSILLAQVWPHRLASGFPEDTMRTGGKTGTLITIRNEVGVVEDLVAGKRYAVAVFTRESELRSKNPTVDAAIGRAARTAVDALSLA